MSQAWIAYKQWGAVGKPHCEEKKKHNSKALCGPSNSTRKREPPRRRKASAWEYRKASICEYRKASACEYRRAWEYRTASACESCSHIFSCSRSVEEGCVRVRCPKNIVIIINATMLIAIRQTNPMHIMHQGYTKAQGACLRRNPPL